MLSVDISPDMGSQSSERRSVWALLLFCRQNTVRAAPLHASLGCLLVWSLLMSDHHRGTRALLRISAKVSLRGCRSCGCFSTMPLASMVRTLVSLVDVSDAISLWALAGTPVIVLDSAAYSQHARVPRAAGTDLWGTACFILRDVAVSVSMRRCVATRSGGE